MTDNEWIFQVVDSFYQKAKTDVLIGYHFRVITDFDSHIPRIATFWEMQLLGKTSRKVTEPFDMMNVHLPLLIKPGELGRWLILFRKTLDEKVNEHPEFLKLRETWEERLQTFEGIFKRFLITPNP
jgi:truncated hemoglobin YjbI